MATTFFPPIVSTLDFSLPLLVPMGPVPTEPVTQPQGLLLTSLVAVYAFGNPTLVDPATEEGTTVTIIGDTVLQEPTGTSARQGMMVGSFNYHDQLGSQSTASFSTIDLDGTYAPATGENVVVYQIINGAPVRLFGGIVDRVTRRHFPKSAVPLVSEVSCIGYGIQLDRRRVYKHFDFSIQYSIFSMIVEILNTFGAGTGVHLAGASGDALITELVSFNYVTISEAIKQLAEPAGLDWTVDGYGNLFLYTAGTGYTAAPYALDDDSDFVVQPVITASDTLRANRVFVRPSRGLPLLRTDLFVADGTQLGFFTDYVIEEGVAPIVELNGTIVDPELVIEYNAFANPTHLFSYVPGGYGVFSNPLFGPMTAGNIVQVTYPHPIPTLPFAEDAAAILADGLIETVIEVKDEQNIVNLQAAAEGALEKMKDRPSSLSFQTRRPGFAPGQILSVDWTQPAFPVFTGAMVITQVTMEDREKVAWYTIEATSTLWQGEGNAVRVWQDLYNRSRGIVSHAGEQVWIKIAQTLGDDVAGNPGTVPTVIQGVHIVQDSGIIEKLTWIWSNNPTTEDITADIFLNGTSILGDLKFTYTTFDTGTVSRITFTSYPLYVAKGDKITAEILSGTDANAKDGTIQINIIR